MKNVYADPAYAQIVQDLKKELLRLKAKVGDRDEDHPHLLEVRKEYWNR